jgi:hypothetical protein
MSSLSERALSIRLATIQSNTEMHDTLLSAAIDYAFREEAIALFEESIMERAKNSVEPTAVGHFYINMDSIASLGPFTLCVGDWAIHFPFRDLLLGMNISEFYRVHPLVISAMGRLRNICGPGATFGQPYIHKDRDTYSIVFTVFFTLPQKLSS